MKLLNRKLITRPDQLSRCSHALLTSIRRSSKHAMSVWCAHPQSATELIALKPNVQKEFAEAIAQNPCAPSELLSTLVCVKEAAHALAQNPKTDADTLRQLAANREAKVQEALAQNPNTPVDALWSMVHNSPHFVHFAMSHHPAIHAAGPGPLLASAHRPALKVVAAKAKLTQPEIMHLWKVGVEVSAALMSNPLLKTKSLLAFLPMLDEKGRIEMAKNPSADAQVLELLAADPSAMVKRTVAAHPNCPLPLLERFSCMERGDVVMGALMNPNVTASVLSSLSKSTQARIREMVAQHPSTHPETLERLSSDAEPAVRAAVGVNPNTPLQVLRRLSGDFTLSVSSAVAKNSAMGVVTQLNHFPHLLKNVGIGAFNFYQNQSPNRVTKLLINSKHPAEVAFLFGSGDCRMVDAISSLQGAFMTTKHKLDRDGYLCALQTITEQVHPSRRLGLTVESVYLKKAMHWFGWPLMVHIFAQYDADEAKDCIRMLALMVSSPRKETNREFHQRIEAWLSNSSPEIPCFHNYLVSINKNMHRFSTIPFFQAQLTGALPDANKLLPKGWSVNLPLNSKELFLLGEAQSHCVGGSYYADRCMDGSNIIFQLCKDGDMKGGYTFQYSRNGRLLQGKGFGNSAVPSSVQQLSLRVAITLLSYSKKEAQQEPQSVAA